MTETAAATEQVRARTLAGPGNEAAQRNRHRRRRADRRFRYYGLAAILLAVLFLVAILADIAIKAWPAFTQSTLKLAVPVTSEQVDAKAPQTGDFDAAVRGALHNLFPEVKTRADRKALDNILSGGAADALRKHIVANPALIGQTVETGVLLSSDADLYIKGLSARTSSAVGTGTAKPSGTSGTVTLEVEPEALTADLAGVTRDTTGAAVFDATKASLLVVLNGGVVKILSVTGGKAEGETLVPLTSAEPAVRGSWRRIVTSSPDSTPTASRTCSTLASPRSWPRLRSSGASKRR